MMAPKHHATDHDPQARQRRRAVVRTALVFGAIAVGIYVAFIASGVLTIAAPWLMQLPAMHSLLEALGCRSLP